MKEQQNDEKRYQVRQSLEATKTEELPSARYRQNSRDNTHIEMRYSSTLKDQLCYHEKMINDLKIKLQIHDYKSGFPSKLQSTAVLAQNTQQDHFYEAVGPGNSTHPKNLPQDNFLSGTQKGTTFSPQSQFPTSSSHFEGNSDMSTDNLQIRPGYTMEENHTNCYITPFIDDVYGDDSLYAGVTHTNHDEADLQNTMTPAEKGW